MYVTYVALYTESGSDWKRKLEGHFKSDTVKILRKETKYCRNISHVLFNLAFKCFLTP